MRRALTIAFATAALAGFVLFGIYLLVVRPVEQAIAPSTPLNARVDMLADKPDALILMPFVTGDVPRLVRGDALKRFSGELWFTDNSDAGNLTGAMLFGMMGMPPTTSIATAFRDNVGIRDFSCLTIGCINWPTKGEEMWGLGRLKGRGDALGPELNLKQQTFTDYAAYKAAHKTILSDPLQWFTKPQAEVLQPPPDNNRLITISLPTRLVNKRPEADPLLEDQSLKAELETLATSLLRQTGGQLESTLGLVPMPLWAMKDGELLRETDGGMRPLPDLVQYDPGLTLRVPREHVETVRQRMLGAKLHAKEVPNLNAALAGAFNNWGIDRDCLPDCGGISPTREFREKAEFDVATEPFWTLDTWQIPRMP